MTQWWRRGAPSEAGTISSAASEEDAAQAAPSEREREGEGARWGDAGLGGVTREQALEGSGVAAPIRRSRLHIDITSLHGSRDNLREATAATVSGGGGGDRNGDGESQATRAQVARANAVRIGALLMYAALVGFFLVILLGNASGGSKLHLASLLVVSCIMGIWFITVCYRCVAPARNEPVPRGIHQRTPISLQEFLAMNHPMTPLRTGVDAKVRQSFRYFRYNDPSDSSDARLAEAELGGAAKPGSGSCGSVPAGSGPAAAAAAAATAAGPAEEDAASATAASAVVAVGSSTPAGAAAPWAQEKICSICLDEFRTGHELCALPCLHTFHAACLGVWLSTHADCPLCKVCLQPPAAAPAEAAEAPAGAAATVSAVAAVGAVTAVTENLAGGAMRAPSHGGALVPPAGPDNV